MRLQHKSLNLPADSGTGTISSKISMNKEAGHFKSQWHDVVLAPQQGKSQERGHGHRSEDAPTPLSTGDASAPQFAIAHLAPNEIGLRHGTSLLHQRGSQITLFHHGWNIERTAKQQLQRPCDFKFNENPPFSK